MKSPWIALLFLLPFAGRAEAQGRPGALEGTFLQLWQDHKTWDASTWERRFNCFERLHLGELVLQFTKVNDLSLLEPTVHPQRPSVIETVFRLARKHHIRVWVGLYADLNYFDNIQKDPEQLGAYLASLRARSLSLARQLEGKIGNPQFAGWYLSEEIPDESFSDPERKSLLFAHLATLSKGLRAIAPKRRIGISGFSNGTLSPLVVERFWQELLAATGIDTVFFQDGIGVGKLTVQTLPGVLRAVRAAVTSRRRELRVVVETFREVQKEPGRFAADPAPWAELRKQLVIARSIAASGIVAFSVPEYMCPESGEQAKALFDDYQQNMGLR